MKATIEFVPQFPRDVCVKSVAIWSIRDDKLTDKQTDRVLRRAGYLPYERRWGIKAAREWLAEQKAKTPRTTKELVASFQS